MADIDLVEPVEEPADIGLAASGEVVRVLDSNSLPAHLDPKVIQPTNTCPKGHTAPVTRSIVVDRDGQELANEPYCAVCFAQYLSSNFPVL